MLPFALQETYRMLLKTLSISSGSHSIWLFFHFFNKFLRLALLDIFFLLYSIVYEYCMSIEFFNISAHRKFHDHPCGHSRRNIRLYYLYAQLFTEPVAQKLEVHSGGSHPGQSLLWQKPILAAPLSCRPYFLFKHLSKIRAISSESPGRLSSKNQQNPLFRRLVVIKKLVCRKQYFTTLIEASSDSG